METDDLSLGLSPVESALPPSRGVCALWLGSLFLLFLFSYCSSYRPPLQSISHPVQNILSTLHLHIQSVCLSGHQSAPQPILSLCRERDNNGPQSFRSVNFDNQVVNSHGAMCTHICNQACFTSFEIVPTYTFTVCSCAEDSCMQGCWLLYVVGGEIVELL